MLIANHSGVLALAAAAYRAASREQTAMVFGRHLSCCYIVAMVLALLAVRPLRRERVEEAARQLVGLPQRSRVAAKRTLG